MKLRIQRRPSILGNPNTHWYYAQIKRFGIWIDCKDDLLLQLWYSGPMLSKSYDTCLDVVEKFVDFVMAGQEMFPSQQNIIIKEYET
jgi:hypothetical protein